MKRRKEKIIILGLILIMILTVIGVSYAAFSYIGTGTQVNSITSGAITMTYTESSNGINMTGALPTTDQTGMVRLTEGEYFDFTITTNIQGNSYINYEISAKAVEGNTMDPDYVKLYLSKVNDDGTESIVMKGFSFWDLGIYTFTMGTVPTYAEEVMSNPSTGRPAGEMSLLTGRITSQGEVSTKYRLRMYVSEDYNPQGDGGGLTFGVKINVYGKNEAMTGPVLKTYNEYSTIYNNHYYRPQNMYQTDFHADEYRDNITSIATKGDTIIPETAITSWDMSAGQDNSVIAYIEDDGTGSGTYKLTIGGEGKIVANPNMTYYFADFINLESIDLSYLDTSIVTDMSNMFTNCYILPELDLSNFNTSNVRDMSFMFCSCNGLISVDISSFKTSNVIDMNSMFTLCQNLLELDLSNFDTSNVIDMSFMFGSNFANTDMSYTKITFGENFKTSKVRNMSGMFRRCNDLTELDVRGFDTSNVTDMSSMFDSCSSLTEINLSHFNTSKVTNMSNMFRDCSSLTEIDVSMFDTSKVTDFYYMFEQCTSLTSLDLRNFDTRNADSMQWMFWLSPNLTEILVDKDTWVTSQANTENMFYNCGTSSVTYV